MMKVILDITIQQDHPLIEIAVNQAVTSPQIMRAFIDDRIIAARIRNLDVRSVITDKGSRPN
ncbi:MAG: hypothetical protein A3I77_01605 [Gammaproteobacteria bacterium RIFCSPLOWO2_02_FULL_42_14]|nr:MAG: hypothetical protein A3B71_07790 [Gammaproteobacteria bacterium RIFCSPHIGHO2_02_FULL_42_43]OGT52318.1 MAG: hypothetical protein A3E54_01665 [Gammaproteobacteria bacterium RIFCSPHIGHO2_12_FULL_41_25]OGT61930.1 MAG: hypothetical protein A3I77_01605 [Gammaproteobacteria bacterium RIFCSPLOWO2_02_FULL_42_14]OGT86359.1 MAG: hypothetical protein A3G86_07490 [Gammaproteobacteria bacterium RIFCSPLOWO2_12_FULL_42_18]